MGHPVLQCESIIYICATSQVERFLKELSAAEVAKFQAAARIAATSIVTGRPPADRWQKVRGTRGPLFELKITAPGSGGPQLRLICARKGNQVLLLRGVRKKSSALSRSEINTAERALGSTTEGEDEPLERKRR